MTKFEPPFHNIGILQDRSVACSNKELKQAYLLHSFTLEQALRDFNQSPSALTDCLPFFLLFSGHRRLVFSRGQIFFLD